MNGTVKFFNNIKGWGLIDGFDGQTYFCHHSHIVDSRFAPDKFRTLKTNQLVKFAPEEIPGKPLNMATLIRIDEIDED